MFEFLRKDKTLDLLVTALEKSIVRFEPEKRYLIIIPSEVPTDMFDNLVAALEESLDFANADTYVAMMHGDASIIEFS